MIYQDVRSAKFVTRPNRFIANIEIDGQNEICHVCNTGRCKELLIPGANVLINRARNMNRRTRYDLIGVYKGHRLINIDSGAPNKIVHEWLPTSDLFPGSRLIKPEYSYGNSRLDFLITTETRKVFVEVKGVTLETDDVALFPDAPTQRGLKHVNDLCQCVTEGNEAYIFFIIQMQGVRHFSPNYATHPEFGMALKKAAAAGVKILALDCQVSPDSISVHDFVKVKL